MGARRAIEVLLPTNGLLKGWCVWLALLLSAPYIVPLVDGATRVEELAAAARLLPLVALGIAIGLAVGFLAPLPRRRGALDLLPRLATAAGTGLSLSIVAAIILSACTHGNAPAAGVGSSGALILLADSPSSAVSPPSWMVRPLSLFLGALLCGWCGGVLALSNSRQAKLRRAEAVGASSTAGPAGTKTGRTSTADFAGRGAIPTAGLANSGATPAARLVPMALCFLLGLVQLPCWSFLAPIFLAGSIVSPASTYAPSFRAFATPGLAAVLSLIPLALSLVLVFGLRTAACGEGGSGGKRLLALVASLCLGVLAWYPVTSLLPASLIYIPLAQQMAPVLCILCLSLVVAQKRRPLSSVRLGTGAVGPRGEAMTAWPSAEAREPHGSPASSGCPDPFASHGRSASSGARLSPGSPITREGLRGLLSEEELARLAACGLTDRELDVVRSHIAGLSSAQAGKLLGISDKTVREYRRRCKVKLGVDDLDEVAPSCRGHGTA